MCGLSAVPRRRSSPSPVALESRATSTGRSVLLRVSQIKLHSVADPLASIHVGIAAEKAGDFALGVRFLGRAVDRLREQGRLGLLTQALVHYAWAATYAGDWSAAAAA